MLALPWSSPALPKSSFSSLTRLSCAFSPPWSQALPPNTNIRVSVPAFLFLSFEFPGDNLVSFALSLLLRRTSHTRRLITPGPFSVERLAQFTSSALPFPSSPPFSFFFHCHRARVFSRKRRAFFLFLLCQDPLRFFSQIVPPWSESPCRVYGNWLRIVFPGFDGIFSLDRVVSPSLIFCGPDPTWAFNCAPRVSPFRGDRRNSGPFTRHRLSYRFSHLYRTMWALQISWLSRPFFCLAPRFDFSPRLKGWPWSLFFRSILPQCRALPCQMTSCFPCPQFSKPFSPPKNPHS